MVIKLHYFDKTNETFPQKSYMSGFDGRSFIFEETFPFSPRYYSRHSFVLFVNMLIPPQVYSGMCICSEMCICLSNYLNLIWCLKVECCARHIVTPKHVCLAHLYVRNDTD